MKKRLLLSAWVLICFNPPGAWAAETNGEPHSLPALQTAIDSVLKETKTPGAAVVIVTSNQLDWPAGIGLADVAANQPVTPDTLFRLGSVSKGFVALAALQLLSRWLNSRTLTVTANGFSFSIHGFYKHRMLPVTERLYRSEDESLASIALLPDGGGQTLIQCGMGTFERIPTVEYWPQLAGISLVCLLVVSSLVMAPIWMVRRWLGKSRNPGPFSVRFLPLVSAALLATFAVLLFSGFRGFLSGTYIDNASLGTPNVLTVSLWLVSRLSHGLGRN